MTKHLWLALLTLALVGCPPVNDDDVVTDDDDDDDGAPSIYEFDNASYSGQVFRHVLISDTKGWIGGMTDRLDAGWFPADGDVVAELDFFFEFDGDVGGDLEHGVSAPLPLDQETYADIASGKDLVGKLAGNDEVGQHEDWSTAFVGWDEDGVTTPESLVRLWFEQLEDQAIAWSVGDYPLDPTGAPVGGVYVTEDGRDLQQLVQKFLLGAVAYSQGTDDYLDDDTAGKGLLADHTADEEGEDFTALEHAWDEGFGYFGAARTYGLQTDDDIADVGAFDADGSGTIDLLSEFCFGHSVNAAKRDRGAVAATDLSAQGFDAFVAGRALLASTDGALTDDEFALLQGYRDEAVAAWEAAIAATVVHYVNDTLQDMAAIGTADYSFGSHAKHWSELKGFALSLQFNPRSSLTDDELIELHDLIGTAPALEGDDLDGYRADLIAARALVGEAHGFDAANLGDDEGLGGW